MTNDINKLFGLIIRKTKYFIIQPVLNSPTPSKSSLFSDIVFSAWDQGAGICPNNLSKTLFLK